MIGKTLIDRYKILEKVGDGGMAIVYRAQDHLLNREVAVKVLRNQFASDGQFVERFRREARSAAGLSHPNIVNIFDVGETAGIHFIVMEYAAGKNLSELLKEEGKFSPEVILSVAMQIALGLAHAHHHGTIHRDIKPHNILMSAEGRIKVTDFGIAQAMSATNLTEPGMVLGSVHYFSPEQARGINVQAASDLYSLGIVLYEMITGRLPFQGDSPVSVALKQIQEEPLPPRHYVPDVDWELEELVLKLLAKKPSQRPSNADEVVRVLQSISRRLEEDGELGEEEEKEKKGVFGLGRPKAKTKSVRRKKTAVKTSKSRKGPLVFLIIILLLGGIGYAATRIIPLILFPGEVRVPNVVGLLEYEAYNVLRSRSLGLKVEQTVFDNAVPAGEVISQNPTAGRMVKENRDILVRVSKGPEEVEMPSVLGLTSREAKLNLTQSGFVLGQESEVFDSNVAPNIVLEQWPEPGGIAAKGTAVNLIISKGQEALVSVELPNFRGQDFAEVKRLVEEMGLAVGNSWSEYSTFYEEGQVVEQNPAPGTKVQHGWHIDFVYSLGVPLVAPPPLPDKVSDPPKEEEEPLWVHEDLWHNVEVDIVVPDGGPQEVVILVIDDFGAREVYRDTHKGGSRIVRTITGRGEDAKLQVYIGARQFWDQYFVD